ncbi:hypothetical protein RhiirA4_483845 [Rhizophagus irregularis]|uniref:Uncharacterized protein n=1 Tax=Rhizophagus irregularis TaxID=588596 RepID=A0A2I1HN41_9GLOM|nr:hypothetical protein RhiirA4_452007 [Rhizophagus irregularis]PKY39889.1 hypothetical protein RhiirA4_453172 [Rhizophagus irregularis]PKY48698.1 hypothetical protein RhiirA4_464360 [Rhizophagus irregularis]PKY60291.1 hypothetical protein RhiirA4_483845 [Rhizophagus irregularis]
MSRLSSNIILDEWFNKIVPKPINNRPGYDMKYVSAYIVNYCYGTDLKKIIGIEWEYDTLSVVKPGQSLVAWAVSVRIRLQELLANQRFSVYHRHCLFAGFGNGKMVNSDYHRPRINKSNMAICFDCWKLVKITDIKPKKTYFSGWRRYGYEIKSEDLMKYHWDNECSKAKTPDGSARIIQRAYRNYKKQPETFAKRVWEAVRNDNTLKEKKFLNMPSRGIRCTVNLDIWYSIDGLYRPYHVPQDQLYDYISYSNTPNFEPAYISPAMQEMILPTSYYQLSNCKSNISEIFISSWYVKQNNLLPSINHLNQLTLRLKDKTKIMIV